MRVSKTITVAANTTTANLLSGLPEGLLMSPTYVKVLANAAATGITMDYRRGVTPLLGSDGSPVNVGSGLVVSELNGDMIVSPTVCRGQQTLRLTNSTGAGIVVTYAYIIPD